MQAEREKRLERITSNLSEYEFQKERARQNRESDTRMRQLDDEARAAQVKLEKIMDSASARADLRADLEDGDLKGDVMKILEQAGVTATDLFSDAPIEDELPAHKLAKRPAPIETLAAHISNFEQAHELGVETIFETAEAAIRKVSER